MTLSGLEETKKRMRHQGFTRKLRQSSMTCKNSSRTIKTDSLTRESKWGEFYHAPLGDLKDDFSKEMPWVGFCLFIGYYSLCEFCNMEYTSKSSFLEMGNKVIGVGFKSSGEARVESIFDQR